MNREGVPTLAKTFMDAVHCPKCQSPMVLRYTRQGPAYICQCPPKKIAKPERKAA